MRLAQAFVAFAFASVSLTALAQQGATPRLPPGAQISPQMTIQASKDGLKYSLPAGVAAKAPALSTAQIDLAKQRKLAIAGEWGLSITQANLKSSFWLTPLQPTAAGGAELEIGQDTPAGISYATSAEMPYGSLAMKRTPSGTWWVGLRSIPVTPKDWLLVECYVSGSDKFGLSADFRRTPGTRDRYERIERTQLVPQNGRIAALFEPSTLGRRWLKVTAPGPEPSTWSWGGCEVTTIQL